MPRIVAIAQIRMKPIPRDAAVAAPITVAARVGGRTSPEASVTGACSHAPRRTGRCPCPRSESSVQGDDPHPCCGHSRDSSAVTGGRHMLAMLSGDWVPPAVRHVD